MEFSLSCAVIARCEPLPSWGYGAHRRGLWANLRHSDGYFLEPQPHPHPLSWVFSLVGLDCSEAFVPHPLVVPLSLVLHFSSFIITVFEGSTSHPSSTKGKPNVARKYQNNTPKLIWSISSWATSTIALSLRTRISTSVWRR